MVQDITNRVSNFTSKWWILLLRGIAAIVVAVIAFTHPGSALVGLVLALGIYAFIAGVLAIWAAVVGAGGEYWWALLLEGIVAIVAALLIWSWPVASTLGFVYFVAAWMIVSGIFQIAGGVQLRDVIDNEWFYILGGIISIAFGVYVFRSGAYGVLATAYLIGWYFLFFGVVQVAMAFKLRSVHNTVAPAAMKTT